MGGRKKKEYEGKSMGSWEDNTRMDRKEMDVNVGN
jgi:hypothetical protein